MGKAARSQRHAPGTTEHTERPSGANGCQRRLPGDSGTGPEEKKGLPEREMMSKGAGVRSHRTTGEEIAAHSQSRASWRKAAKWTVERGRRKVCAMRQLELPELGSKG